jgi:hypothetical protein
MARFYFHVREMDQLVAVTRALNCPTSKQPFAKLNKEPANFSPKRLRWARTGFRKHS